MKRFLRTTLLFIAFAPFTAMAAVTVSETHLNVTCFGGNNGSIEITPDNGVAPYTFQWSDADTSQNRDFLSAGNYQVTVTDNLGESATASVLITEPTAISVSKNITHVACGGDSTGAIDLTISGGTPGYTFLWSDGATTEDRVNITAANRYFTITDLNGCTKFDSANVTQPPGMVITKSTTDQTCSGANGAIDLTVQFGIPGYFYLWNDSATTQDRTGIYAGNYSVTVTDNSGCTVSASMTVGLVVTPMSINYIAAQPSCNGGNNGTIIISSVIGSSGPFTYLWSDGDSSQDRIGVPAGVYSVTVTASTSCTATEIINIGEPTAMSDSLFSISVSCNGGSNGIINTTVWGGTSPYSYSWSDGGFTQNRTGLSSAIYTVTITDFKGCKLIDSILVDQPALALTVTAVPSPLACTGGPSGSVFSNVTGGTSPYYYWWGGAVISQNRVNVPSGTYCVTVTDNNGCTAVACAVIPPYTPMSTSETHTDVLCTGDSTGSIDLTVINGSAPYQYSWNTTDTTQDLSNLSQGTYTVTVLDNHTCTVTRAINITEPSFQLAVNTTLSNVTCYGENDGSISLSPYNGNPPYLFSWNNSEITSSINGLSAGTYDVTITDDNGCSITSSATVTEPTPIILSLSPVDVRCYGDSTGEIHLSATGSFAPYSYSWSDGGENVQNRNNLPAGTYSVLLTDNHNCTATASTTINQPAAPLTVVVNKGNISCNGDSTGFLHITASSGTAPYTYDWGGGITLQNRDNLKAGVYSLTVTDSVGCVDVSSYTIIQPDPIVVSGTVTDVLCSGANAGEIELSVSGGIPFYSYSWDSGYSTATISNLFAGTYTVTISDVANCSTIYTAVVSQSSLLSVSSSVTNVTCNGGDNGAISVSVNGGALPYDFLWNDNATTQDRTGIYAGNYSVSVTDANGCSAAISETITEPTVITTSISVTNTSCFGSYDGSIDLTVSGGTGIYFYEWSNTHTTQNISSLSAGNYSVDVTDTDGCSSSASAVVSNPAQITLTTAQTNASCGSATGSIDLTVSGGTSPYTFEWSNNETTEDVFTVAAGAYSVTVRDVNSCSASTSATVSQTDSLTISETHTNVSCNGMNNGTAEIMVSGGAGAYSFEWNDGTDTSVRSALFSGNYSVTATDADGCSSSISFSITSPPSLLLAVTKTDAACNGGTGSTFASISGGSPPYFYLWNTNDTTPDLLSAAVGNYSVIVSDQNSCSVSSSIAVNQPNAISITLSKNDISCNGAADGSIISNVVGGAGNYTYEWSNSETTPDISALAADTYVLSVTDINSCLATSSITINEPAPISISETHTNVSCFGGSDATITLSVNGGTSSYGFIWNDGNANQNRSGISTGNYSVSVTDVNLCSASASVIISEPTVLTVSETHVPYACSTAKGSIDITPNGGTAPYNFNWSYGAVIEDVNNLEAGNYSVTVNDVNSCSASVSVNISALPALISSLTKTDAICNRANNGSVNLTVSGGTTPYSYQWTNGATTQNLSGVAAGNYTVVITDGNNCTTHNSIAVGQPNPAQINSSVTPTQCYGDSSGAIYISVNGGSEPYTFAWSNFSSSQNISSLKSGNYSVTVTDANGCEEALTNITVPQPQRLNVSTDVTPVSCSGRFNGEIRLNVIGGSAPYSYRWNNQSTNSLLGNLEAGIYFVTVIDFNGCQTTVSQSVGYAPPLAVYSSFKNTACAQVEEGSVDLTVMGGTPPYFYRWNNGSNTEDLSNLAPGTYSVSITDSRDCSAMETFNIAAAYELEIETSIESSEIYAGEAVELRVVTSADNGNTYSWTPSDDLSCGNCATTTASPRRTTSYTVNVVDSNGCEAIADITLTVKNAGDIFIPNVFTPNSDGNNDVFEIYGDKGNITFLNFSVFNRWGEKVYETSDPNFAWDGVYKSEIVSPGVYVYIMKVVFANGTSSDEYKGSITVLR